ncbi:hypothetical protein [Shewanella sp. UCD-KL12]|uniref:hypothetical protein n=1 Tax=Shewanella sp. UCD-KL12 TaxID=1917163 RepID=UPI0009711C41|nr:hypothetical protein [Shewanella sp. UCD-KL12]
MTKQLAHLVLIISLVGQFMLTPAMAMPSFLHAFTHAQMSQMDHGDNAMKTLEPALQQSPTPNAIESISDTDIVMQHGEKDCDMVVSNMSANNSDILIDCDALCEMMGAGDCISHCASATGILLQAQFDISSPESDGKVQTLSWSTQTIDPVHPNPPPIWQA